MYVCLCHAVTEAQIVNAVSQGANDLESIADKLGAGTCCGGCHEQTLQIIRQQSRKSSSLHIAPACNAEATWIA
ncbi:MAG: (2Fe-2S)-binding protein [Pseudomonadales bacterium]|nr:(2Fe-2S)-binding protein [Pseudomonadales bacterium]